MKEKDVKKIGKRMKKSTADEWVENYKESQKKEPTYGWLYGCDILCNLLEEKGAEGIWFFKGLDDDGKERLVLYPADKDGNIIKKQKMKSLGAKSNTGDDDDDEAADNGRPCPPNCPGPD